MPVVSLGVSLKSQCSGLNGELLKSCVHLEPVHEDLFGKRVFTDVITLRI